MRTPVTRDRFALGDLDLIAVTVLEEAANQQVYQRNVVLVVEIGDRVGVAERTAGVGWGAGRYPAVVLSPPLGPPRVGPGRSQEGANQPVGVKRVQREQIDIHNFGEEQERAKGSGQ